MLRALTVCTASFYLLAGCLPPEEEKSIVFVAPISDDPIALDESGTLRMTIVVDMDGVIFSPDTKDGDLSPVEAHYHLTLLEPPAGITPEDVPKEVYHEFVRESFPPGTHSLAASLRKNDHTEFLDRDDQPVVAILEFNVVAFGE